MPPEPLCLTAWLSYDFRYPGGNRIPHGLPHASTVPKKREVQIDSNRVWHSTRNRRVDTYFLVTVGQTQDSNASMLCCDGKWEQSSVLRSRAEDQHGEMDFRSVFSWSKNDFHIYLPVVPFEVTVMCRNSVGLGFLHRFARY